MRIPYIGSAAKWATLSPAGQPDGFQCVCNGSYWQYPLRRYQRLLADAEQKVFRVLPAFETDNLDRAYDVAEGARCVPVRGSKRSGSAASHAAGT